MYTVKQLSSLSKVSIRTLHYYEEYGLLEPAYYGSNGYRYYEKKQLLQLQQILFFKELGFTLKQVKDVLNRSDFDQLKALYAHKARLTSEVKRLKQLSTTVDRTISDLKGEKPMDDTKLYGGFLTKEKQKEYEEYLSNRWGKDHPAMVETKANTKGWDQKKWTTILDELDGTMLMLKKCHSESLNIDSQQVQEAIKEHHDWLQKFWKPDKQSYKLLGETYLSFEYKEFFDKYDPEHPKLAHFMSKAMNSFADTNL